VEGFCLFLHRGTPYGVSYALTKFHIDPCSVEASGMAEVEHRCLPKSKKKQQFFGFIWRLSQLLIIELEHQTHFFFAPWTTHESAAEESRSFG
jgi:hypothetical protein